MNGPPFSLPGGALLAAWRRDLDALKPSRWWYARLLFHRVEVLALESRSVPLDPLHAVLLRALALPVPSAALASLHLDRQLQSACLRELRNTALVRETGIERYELTPAGTDALATGRGIALARRRRTFFFVETDGPDQAPGFVDADLAPDAACVVVGPRFDLTHLHRALDASPEWKARHGFPADVLMIFTHSATASRVDWQNAILIRSEERNIVLVETPSGTDRSTLLGFLVDVAAGQLQTQRPIFRLEDGARDVFSELADAPSAEAWRRSWENWCGALPNPDPALAASPVALADGKLIARLPRQLADWLRSLPGNPLRQEGFVLAGTGRIKWPAAVEVIEEG